jgi:hypothetical protein
MTELFSEDIQRKENQIAELTKTWAGKWDGYQNILEDSNLALHSEGIKMTVAAEQPHFLAVDDDALGTGVVIYRLQGEATTIGSAESNPKPDIELNGLDIEAQHCLVEHVQGKVYLTPLSGATSVNTEGITCKTKLTHGDIVQLGSTTVFRFNHPREAAEMKDCPDELRAKGRLLELSPISPRDTLEEQRLAMERRYEEKLESMRREMESRNELEKSKLKQELEKLRVSSAITIPSVSVEEELGLGSPGMDNDPYNVMKSVAFEPLDLSKKRTASFNIKDITGGRQDFATNRGSSMRALRFSQSPSPSRSSLETELPVLSPATGQHNTAASQHVDACVDSQHVQSLDGSEDSMRKLLETYEVVGEGSGTLPTPCTGPLDMPAGATDLASSSAIDLGYVSQNMSRFQVDTGLSKSCPEHRVELPGVDQPDCHPAQGLHPEDELSSVERQLDGDGILGGEDVQGGVVWRRRRGDTEKVRKLAKQLSHDVELLKKEKEEYSLENAELKQKLEEISSPLQSQNESVLDYRRRSYAQSEGDLKPRVRRVRSNSLSDRTTRFVLSIDDYYLRGKGLTSYHVYKVLITLGSEKWNVYKRYQDFQKLHDDMRRRYTQFSSLSLPPSKWIGHKTDAFVRQRRIQLQDYMYSLIAVLRCLRDSPLTEKPGKKLTKNDLISMSSFFDDSGPVYATVS